MSEFAFESLEELHRQLARGPLRVRREQVQRLEALVEGLEPDRLYPYDFLFYRITRYRPREDVRESFPGADLLPDLLTMLRELSAGAPADVAEAGERIYTLAEVAGSCNVSARTVRRWRLRGLPTAFFRFSEGDVRMGVRESVLARFLERNAELVRSSGRFSRLSASEQAEIVRRARSRVAGGEASLTGVATEIAEQLGRAPETVRLALLRHDRENPAERIFERHSRRSRRDIARRLWAAYVQGTPVEELAQSFSRSRSTIYRLINRQRALDLLAEPPSSRGDPAFASPDADEAMLGRAFRALLRRAEALPARALEDMADGEWKHSPLSQAEEAALLRGLNYARHKAARLQEELDPRRYVPSALLDEIDSLLALVKRVREVMLRIHAPLAEHIARQHAGGGDAPAELLSHARAQLGEAVDSFDYDGPARFAAHANLEMLKFFARQAGAADDPPAGDR
jgi:transposase